MIIAKAPLRISFFSGGSDIRSYYSQRTGYACSATINLSIYCAVHSTVYKGIKTMYDDVQHADNVSQLNHKITAEAIKAICPGQQNKSRIISSFSDINAKGSGLGSSSAFTVALTHALSLGRFESMYGTHLIDESILDKYIAETACDIEINKCGFPIGKQDQYASTYGGFNLFSFFSNDEVGIQQINVSRETVSKLEENLILVYSGKGRDANAVLTEQATSILNKDKFELVRKNSERALVAANLLSFGKVDDFGALLGEAWEDKRRITKSISNDFIDGVYRGAIANGALGGKILGAGGGGFFLFYCLKEKKQEVVNYINTIQGMEIYPFRFTNNGSTIIHNDEVLK